MEPEDDQPEREDEEREPEPEPGRETEATRLISQRGYYKLDPLERALIVHAKRKNPALPNQQLAKMFGIHATAVDRMVKRYALMPPIKELLATLAPEAVRDMKRASTVAAERGDPAPAEKILIHAGELEPIADRNERAFGPQIIVGILPGMPAAPEPSQKALSSPVEAVQTVTGTLIEPTEP